MKNIWEHLFTLVFCSMKKLHYVFLFAASVGIIWKNTSTINNKHSKAQINFLELCGNESLGFRDFEGTTHKNQVLIHFNKKYWLKYSSSLFLPFVLITLSLWMDDGKMILKEIVILQKVRKSWFSENNYIQIYSRLC